MQLLLYLLTQCHFGGVGMIKISIATLIPSHKKFRKFWEKYKLLTFANNMLSNELIYTSLTLDVINGL